MRKTCHSPSRKGTGVMASCRPEVQLSCCSPLNSLQLHFSYPFKARRAWEEKTTSSHQSTELSERWEAGSPGFRLPPSLSQLKADDNKCHLHSVGNVPESHMDGASFSTLHRRRPAVIRPPVRTGRLPQRTVSCSQDLPSRGKASPSRGRKQNVLTGHS